MTTQTLPDLNGRTVGEIAATLPGAIGVFRKFKVNFCCGGDVTLAEAARRRGLSVSALEEALHSLEASDASDAPALRSLDTDALINHILHRYHEVHRRELTTLVDLARKVETVHAGHPDLPHGLANLLFRMRGELEVHMKKEELILFPAMRRARGNRLDGPIAQMRHDHDDQGEQLRLLEGLTNDFTPPATACRSWQALYAGTAKLVEDLMEHVHLENHVLFPRFEGASAS